MSREIQLETEQNLISTSTFCLATYILHFKYTINKDHFYTSGSVQVLRLFWNSLDVQSQQIIIQFETIKPRQKALRFNAA